jgi:hypothetical protein
MAFSREFIVDAVYKQEEYFGWENTVLMVEARWKITHSDFPGAAVFHRFVVDLDTTFLSHDTYVPIDQVTDAILEEWVTAPLTQDQISAIEGNALPALRRIHYKNSLTVHYQNPDLVTPAP